MSVLTLHCPHCATRLRVRDQSFVGRTIHCPDCTLPLEIVRAADGGVIGRPTESAAAGEHRAAPLASPPGEGRPTSGRRKIQWTPTRIGWTVAGGLAALFLAWGWFGRRSAAPPPREAPPAPVAAAPEPLPAPPAARVPPPATEPGDVPPEAAARLQALAGWIGEYRERHGMFPAENPRTATLPPESRLGWLAELVAEREPGGIQPLWDRPIDDALNGRFVRRPLPALLNPELREVTSDGFPAAHFVGVAGVGADAPRLPTHHPRAGIFGIGRSTRVEDVRDGLSQTLLLVGVERGMPPWAAGGNRTIRGFTAEPYIHGPDGFGTGQRDGMFVALADGSVRFLSLDTAPVVIRRMAAMADGWPLDPAVPGEPGVTPPAPAVAHAVPDAAAAAPEAVPPPAAEQALPDEPIAALVARDPPPPPPPPQYDLALALQQPIRRFSQARPVKCRELLRQVEELAGIPIVLDAVAQGPAADKLDREVSLELSDTTVEGILAALVARVGLGYETGREFGIRLIVPESSP